MGTYKKRFIIIIILAVIAVVSSFLIFASKHVSVDSQFIDDDQETMAAAKGKGKGKVGQAVVYVTGAVGQPGMYNLNGSLRVNELVALAGGLLPEADVSKVNMAQVAKDGMHVNIPFIKEKSPQAVSSARQVRSQQPATVVETVNINKATVEELAGVSGISPKLATKIVKYRDAHGAFASLEDLLKVNGFSLKQLTKLQDKLIL
jgi:competence protein ComEA